MYSVERINSLCALLDTLTSIMINKMIQLLSNIIGMALVIGGGIYSVTENIPLDVKFEFH